jgi:hypothetical protein
MGIDLAEVGMTTDVMSAFVSCNGWRGGPGDCVALLSLLGFFLLVIMKN